MDKTLLTDWGRGPRLKKGEKKRWNKSYFKKLELGNIFTVQVKVLFHGLAGRATAMFFHYFWQSTFLVSALWKCIIYIYSNFQKINLVICFKNYVSLQPIKTYVKFSSHNFQSFIKNEIISMKKKETIQTDFWGRFFVCDFSQEPSIKMSC